MKTYISGLIEPLSDEVRQNFEDAEKYLVSINCTPVNPLKLPECDSLATWPDRLKVLSGCDAIYLLDGWSRSQKALVEKIFSEINRISVLYQTPAEGNKKTIEILRIESAIEEVLGMKLPDYEDGPRDGPRYFARMIFSFQCHKAGLSPIGTRKYIIRSRTNILRYLKKYDEECRYNPSFRDLAERVDHIMHPLTTPNN